MRDLEGHELNHVYGAGGDNGFDHRKKKFHKTSTKRRRKTDTHRRKKSDHRKKCDD
jgi:hypothetical protein